MEYLFNDENTHLSISLGLTLAVVAEAVGVSGIGGVSLGHGVKALGDGVQTSAGAEGDIGVETGISVSITLKQSNIDKMCLVLLYCCPPCRSSRRRRGRARWRR